MAIGKKLEALLKFRGKKPGTLATETGISKNTIYAIIKRDNEKVNMSTLEAIADALDVSIDYFFDKDFDACMIDRKEPAAHDDSEVEEAIQLFYRLTPEQRRIVESVMRGLLGASAQPGTTQD